MNILIVEDELLIAHNLTRILQKLSYTIVGMVSSGETAIQMAAEKKPDLVLMDIVIKGSMNGIEAAQIIQKQYNIPVIYVTAYADEKTVERAKETGAYGFIVKPFKKEQLHGAIQIAMGHHERVTEMVNRVKTQAFTAPLNRHDFLALAEKDFKWMHQYNQTLSMPNTFSVLTLQIHPNCSVDRSNYLDESFLIALIEAIAQATAPILRRIDYIGWLETFNFAIVLANSTYHDAERIAVRIKQAITELTLTLHDQPIHLAAYLGIGVYHPEDDSFLKILDRAQQDLSLPMPASAAHPYE